MRVVTDEDVRAVEKKVKVVTLAIVKPPMLFVESWLVMLIIGALHAQPHLHGLPAIGYWSAVGVRYIVHLLSRKGSLAETIK